MAYLFSNTDLDRKFKIVKDNLYKDEFYNDKILCRYINVEGGDDIYDRDSSQTVTDKIIQGILERGVIFNNYTNMIEVADGDIRLAIRSEDSEILDEADEIWIDFDYFEKSPIYHNYTTKELTQGSAYIIKSKKPSIRHLDDIYILGLKGKLS